MHKFTYTQIKRFKLEAKTRSRASEIGHIKALDCIAHEQGFGNWSLLMKTAAPDTDDSVASFKFIRTNDDMRSAMRNRLEIFDRVPGRYAPPNMDVASIWNEFSSVTNVVDFAIDYMAAILKLPRFHVGLRSLVYWEMRLWLPYSIEFVTPTKQILVNRHYKPVGMDTREHIVYEKFESFHTNLSSDQIKTFSDDDYGQGYLYGPSPWSSRKHAELYLNHLKTLRLVLH
ncbi:hypothetical protein ACO0LL_01710 [Undibacterium sp. TC4M20W]|uniref:hypothetical protein n=1 Tax=Undibacterium sp. TC4M20W TaxID=3413052 RepID=UPI003BF29E94